MKYPDIRSEKFAEFIGVILGDGSIGIYKSKNPNRNSTQYRIKISTNSIDDIEYASYLEELIYTLFGLRACLKIRKNEHTADILLFKKELVQFLVGKVGLKTAPKIGRVEIPESYLGNNLELNVLRGLFDTDGCLVITDNNGTTYPRLELKMIKSPMQRQVIEILKRHGFNLKLYPQDKDSRVVKLQLNGLAQLYRWLSLIGFSNKKHSNKAVRFLNINTQINMTTAR